MGLNGDWEKRSAIEGEREISKKMCDKKIHFAEVCFHGESKRWNVNGTGKMFNQKFNSERLNEMQVLRGICYFFFLTKYRGLTGRKQCAWFSRNWIEIFGQLQQRILMKLE